jgi:hypothetical protein
VAFWCTCFDGEETVQTLTLGFLLLILRTFRNMNCDHFYVTLFSNASQKMYPSNKIAAFTINLARPIELGTNVKWEVG